MRPCRYWHTDVTNSGGLTGTRTRQRPAEGSCHMLSLSDSPPAACMGSRVPALQESQSQLRTFKGRFGLQQRSRRIGSRRRRKIHWHCDRRGAARPRKGGCHVWCGCCCRRNAGLPAAARGVSRKLAAHSGRHPGAPRRLLLPRLRGERCFYDLVPGDHAGRFKIGPTVRKRRPVFDANRRKKDRRDLAARTRHSDISHGGLHLLSAHHRDHSSGRRLYFRI
jgi:hypothetical protein